jgi:pSer/pThr/pTyr-binding forkhead associated (FHA) protein
MKPIALIRIVNEEDCDSQKYEILPGKVRTIGRSEENNIIIQDPKISRKHATVEYTYDGTIYVWDNQSTNGTFYLRNGEINEIQKRTQLFNQDILIINKDYKFKIEKINPLAEKNAKQKKSVQDTEKEIILD